MELSRSDRLAHDLKHAFPAMAGFSPRNLKYMRQFCEAWPDRAIVQRTVARLPWRSNITRLDKLRTTELRRWYAEKRQMTQSLPDNLKPSLPSVQEIEAELLRSAP